MFSFLKSLEEVLEKAETLVDEGDFQGAGQLVARGLKRWRSSSELWTLSGEIALEIGHPERSEQHFREAIRCSSVNAYGWGGLGRALLETGKTGEALTAMTEAVRLKPGHAELVYGLATSLDVSGEYDAADEAYREAHRLSPDFYFVPFRVTREEFDRLTRLSFNGIPAAVRESLGRVTIDVRDTPGEVPSEMGEEALPPLLLGLFIGEQRGDDWSMMGGTAGLYPSRVYLFQRNIERASPDGPELQRQIEITLLHEIGHYLGLEEEDLEARGLD